RRHAHRARAGERVHDARIPARHADARPAAGRARRAAPPPGAGGPRPAPGERLAPGRVAHRDPDLAGVRILVVDDDLGICQSLRDLLTQEGCEVVVATGGREALTRLESMAIDLVLSDVVMPDLDGYQLFQEVRRRYTGLPVVLMTAFHFDKDHVI